MKKIFSVITIIGLIVFLSNCKGCEAKEDIELYNYLHLKDIPDAHGFFINEILTITSIERNDFKLDSARFKDTLGSVLTPASLSFIFSVKQFYSVIQTKLGLIKKSEIAGSKKMYSGIRMYPALDTTQAQKELYLVIMGERVTAGPLNLVTLVDTTIFSLRNNVISAHPFDSPGYEQLNLDILAFQKYWMDRFNYASKDLINRSINFSISEYYEMLNDLETGMINDTTGNNNYKIALYPCLKDRKLHVVAKGMRDMTPMENKSFFNNMDVCPKSCPEIEVK